MIRKIIGLLLLSAFLPGYVFAHSGKPKYHVVIDTDGAIDDMRAITMLLSGNDIRVLAISCSQGTLMPDSVYLRVRSLLTAFHHEGIPVGTGEMVDSELPAWSSFAGSIQWGSKVPEPDLPAPQHAVELLNRVAESYQEKITLVALGSLKTYADWVMMNPAAAEKIERIIWYNNHNVTEGFNYQVMPESFDFIKQRGIMLDIVSGSSDGLAINQDYLEHIEGANSRYADQIDKVHARPSVIEMIHNNHLRLWDDLVPLYLTVPIMFKKDKDGNLSYISLDRQIPQRFIHETIAGLLVSATEANNRVFTAFPIDTTLYQSKYSGMVQETIEKYGTIEWKAITMTNEIHGHTGIYSIIGAKMGIRAMEYFNVGVNNLKVISYAGNTPPLSCLNDGIQISTGATIGQGLITVADSLSAVPAAHFEFNNQKVHMSLKAEFAGQMQQEIAFGVKKYGLHTDQYWLYIEELAIRYWAEFDRLELFDINE